MEKQRLGEQGINSRIKQEVPAVASDPFGEFLAPEGLQVDIATNRDNGSFTSRLLHMTVEQEAVHKRVIAAQFEQVEAAEAVTGRIIDLPQDTFGLPDEARQEKVIVDFNILDFRRETI